MTLAAAPVRMRSNAVTAFRAPLPFSSNLRTAYGGGKQVGVGGAAEDPEVAKAKAAATAAALAAFRKAAGGASPDYERLKAPEIRAALATSRRAMARGYCDEAVEALSAVEGYLSYGTLAGGGAFIELGMACEGAGDLKRAAAVYAKVASQCSDEALRRQAKQLLFGFEAMDFFKVGATTHRPPHTARRCCDRSGRAHKAKAGKG